MSWGGSYVEMLNFAENNIMKLYNFSRSARIVQLCEIITVVTTGSMHYAKQRPK